MSPDMAPEAPSQGSLEPLARPQQAAAAAVTRGWRRWEQPAVSACWVELERQRARWGWPPKMAKHRLYLQCLAMQIAQNHSKATHFGSEMERELWQGHSW